MVIKTVYIILLPKLIFFYFHLNRYICGQELEKFNCRAIIKNIKIPKPVKIFNERCAELGDPNKSVFVAKLANPTFS